MLELCSAQWPIQLEIQPQPLGPNASEFLMRSHLILTPTLHIGIIAHIPYAIKFRLRDVSSPVRDHR